MTSNIHKINRPSLMRWAIYLTYSICQPAKLRPTIWGSLLLLLSILAKQDWYRMVAAL
jgi:hypothetical protein